MVLVLILSIGLFAGHVQAAPTIGWGCSRINGQADCPLFAFPDAASMSTTNCDTLKTLGAGVPKINAGEVYSGRITILNPSSKEVSFSCATCNPDQLKPIDKTSANFSAGTNVDTSVSMLSFPIMVTEVGTQDSIYGLVCIEINKPASTQPTDTSGQDSNSQLNISKLNKLKVTNLPALIGMVIRGLMGVAGMIAFIMILYGGILWMTAAGNASQQEKAQNTIVWSGLGIILIFASYALISFIFDIFR